jgi:hypothetical protein
VQVIPQQSVPALQADSSAPQHVPFGPQLPPQQSAFDSQDEPAGLQHMLVMAEH